MLEIVLGYTVRPVWRGGHSFTIYEDGVVKYKKFEYVTGVTESRKIFTPKTVIEDVKKILTEKKFLIDKLPKQIDGWFICGDCYYFNFAGKEISCWNICRTSEEDYKEFERYLDKVPNIYELIQQQNSVLEIFESVYDILKDYGLKVKSWKYFSCDWEM